MVSYSIAIHYFALLAFVSFAVECLQNSTNSNSNNNRIEDNNEVTTSSYSAKTFSVKYALKPNVRRYLIFNKNKAIKKKKVEFGLPKFHNLKELRDLYRKGYRSLMRAGAATDAPAGAVPNTTAQSSTTRRSKKKNKNKVPDSLYYYELNDNKTMILNEFWFYTLSDVVTFFKLYLDTDICYKECEEYPLPKNITLNTNSTTIKPNNGKNITDKT